MSEFHLVLLLHAHQPVGNFEQVYERAYRSAYLPFLQSFKLYPRLQIGLHLSGPLWEWLAERHPDFLELVAELVERGQIELVGGGFYEPILVAISPADRVRQITALAEHLERLFGVRPRGMWLAERVWEPHLVTTLRQAGVDYTLVDDAHFLASGLDPEQLYGYYRVEELGESVKVFPGLQRLRYQIPFDEPEQVIEFLRVAASQHPGGMAAMGDDLEKFGVWPGTHQRCYDQRWLARLFELIEREHAWLRLTAPGTYCQRYPACGRAALPAASYPEMMTWALPTPARIRLEQLEEEFAQRPEVREFLRGGIWRNFLVKYPEANLLHQRMLWLAAKLDAAEASGLGLRSELAAARRHLLRAQCNDAYWHGIFGGVYAPHLRQAVQQELLQAERALGLGRGEAVHELHDFDGDGHPELMLWGERYAALILPGDGATLARLDFLPAQAVLVNALARRPEAYHRHVAGAAVDASVRGSIHRQRRAREPGLERWLRYDRWLRHGFRLLLFGHDRSAEDYFRLALGEEPAPAAGRFAIERVLPHEVTLLAEELPVALAGNEPMQLRCHKNFRFRAVEGGFAVRCVVSLAHNRPAATLRCRAGLELVFNLLAPNSEDRYFVLDGERKLLGWQGTLAAGPLRLVDEHQRLVVTVAPVAGEQIWIAPIETVNDSEEGFERIYQGSQILLVWPVELPHGETWQAMLDVRVTALDRQ